MTAMNPWCVLPDDATPYHEEQDVVIFHGDCREILPQLLNKSIDLVWTDPPYGHNNNNGDLIHRREAALGHQGRAVDSSRARPIANDGEEANDLVRWLFRESKRILKQGACCCCCCGGGGGPDPQFARWALWMDECLTFKQMIVWDKGPIGMGWHYRRSYETVLVGQRDTGKCNWYDETDRIENIIRHIPKVIPKETDHPTPKPTELSAHFIQLHTRSGDVVLDPFMGGGSTAEAAKRLGRRFIGVELDARWLSLVVERVQQQVLPL